LMDPTNRIITGTNFLKLLILKRSRIGSFFYGLKLTEKGQ